MAAGLDSGSKDFVAWWRAQKNQMEVCDPQTSTSILVEKCIKRAIILVFLKRFLYRISGQ